MDPTLVEGVDWLNQAIPSRRALPQSLRDLGEELVVRLRERAIDLSHNRATEFSPDIETLHFTAAKVALLIFGVDASEGEIYERDAVYYRAFAGSASSTAEYEEFKRSCA